MSYPASILVITGATATGKTAVGVHCAEILGGEIISADSRQVYRGMDIGTAKPTQEERAGIPHHCLDCSDPWERYSAGIFVREAMKAIQDITARGRVAIVVGGAGLYIRALTRGLFEDVLDPKIRDGVEREMRERDPASILEELQRLDPEGAATLPVTNPARLQRALEICRSTGLPFSRVRRERMSSVPFTACLTGLERDRIDLRDRIETRVDEMMEGGLPEEVQRLLDQQGSENWPGLKTVGYAEVARYVRKEWDRDHAVQEIKKNTWAFARRQRTWFRREPVEWFSMEPDSTSQETARLIAEYYKQWRMRGSIETV